MNFTFIINTTHPLFMNELECEIKCVNPKDDLYAIGKLEGGVANVPCIQVYFNSVFSVIRYCFGGEVLCSLIKL